MGGVVFSAAGLYLYRRLRDPSRIDVRGSGLAPEVRARNRSGPASRVRIIVSR